MTAIDTNILIYAISNEYPHKKEIAQKLIKEIFEGRKTGVVTNQILAEFARVALYKLEKPLSKEQVQAIIGSILTSANWSVFNYNGKTVLHTVQSASESFWDSLIAETLKENKVENIITENTKDFAATGLKTLNPFAK
ncbi:TPA: PIN domain-containing protein [Candidatus Woesearchaeota archaeon]|nr:PIN domain-containing protein [Candidatus Woesearchaeota archaeon]